MSSQPVEAGAVARPGKPKRWIAVLLGIFLQPLAMLYVDRPGWAGLYLLLTLALGLAQIWMGEPVVLGLLQLVLIVTCAVHAFRAAGKHPEGRERAVYSRWYGLVGIAAAFALLGFTVRAFVVEPFRQPSGSMQPNIRNGASLVAQKWGYGHYGSFGVSLWRAPISAPLDRGDIVVYEVPGAGGTRYVKRLVAVGGDRIEYRENKLSVNDRAVIVRQEADVYDPETLSYRRVFVESLGNVEYAILHNTTPARFMLPRGEFVQREKCSFDAQGMACVVPDGHYFLLGDNRDNSDDSRYWGFLPADRIVGKVVHVSP
jgi:signal peptidase I